MKLHKNTGFTVVEVVAGLAIVGILVFAVWAYTSQDSENNNDENIITPTTKPETMNGNETTSPIEEASSEREILPTTTPIPNNSNDETINQVTDEINTLEIEINALDEIDNSLDIPELDLSVE